MPTREELKARRDEVSDEIKRLTNFDQLTVAQRTKAGELSTEFNELDAELTELDRADVAAKVKSGKVAFESGDGHRPATTAPSAATGADTPQLPAWAVKGRRTAGWATSTAAQVVKAVTATGRKAIVSGAYEVDSPVRSDILQLPAYPQRVLDLLVNREPLNTGNVFTWLEQSVRTNNAASAPDGTTKPTSVYTFLEKEDRCRVIAHLSENIPTRFLSDFSGLQDFLHAEMLHGLSLEVERQVLNGTGTPGAASQAVAADEDMLGLLNTTGISVQAWNTNLLTTLRKAVTKLELGGQIPTAWALNPNDVEALDLLQDNEARHYYEGPQQQITEGVGPIPNTSGSPLWSIPVIKSVAVPAGTAILGDWSLLTLVVREDAQLTIDASGTRWEKNQFAMRLEGRYGVYVQRPSAFCSVDLTA